MKWLKSLFGLNRNLNLALLKSAEAGDLGIVCELLAQGADTKAKDEADATPLHKATPKGHASVVEELIKAGADKDAKNKHRERTPLHLAASLDQASVVEVLVRAG